MLLIIDSIDGLVNNTNVCQSPPCQKNKKKSLVVPIVASVAAVSVGLLAAGLIFLWMVKKRKQQQGVVTGEFHIEVENVNFLYSNTLIYFYFLRKLVIRRVEAEGNHKTSTFETKNRQFTYSDVLSMTNNFQRVIGNYTLFVHVFMFSFFLMFVLSSL